MTLTEEQIRFYRGTLDATRKQLAELAAEIERERARVRDGLAELAAQERASRLIHQRAHEILAFDPGKTGEEV